jgi:hypothetical protein
MRLLGAVPIGGSKSKKKRGKATSRKASGKKASRGAVPIGGTEKRQKPFSDKKHGAHPSRGTVVSGIPSRMTRDLCESLWYHIATFCETRAVRSSVKKESRGAVPIGGSKKNEKTFFWKNETRILAEARRCDGYPRV